MRILEKMKIDLRLLWKQAMNADTPAIRSDLLKKYHVIYSGYKKQVRFFEAMSDGKQTNMNIKTSEQQIQN